MKLSKRAMAKKILPNYSILYAELLKVTLKELIVLDRD